MSQPRFAPPETAAEARRMIPDLAARVATEDRIGEVALIGGADASSTRFDPERTVYAAMVSLGWPSLTEAAHAGAVRRGGLPYIPGLLGFREVPALLDAWERLSARPDLVMVDGHGVAHPRGLGIACLLGVMLDVPTIGVAKSILVGELAGPLGEAPGDRVPLVWQGRQLGVALRTRRGANPLYISPGHRVSLPTALAWVERCLRGRRLPEPTRAAHDAASIVRREAGGAVAPVAPGDALR